MVCCLGLCSSCHLIPGSFSGNQANHRKEHIRSVPGVVLQREKCPLTFEGNYQTKERKNRGPLTGDGSANKNRNWTWYRFSLFTRQSHEKNHKRKIEDHLQFDQRLSPTCVQLNKLTQPKLTRFCNTSQKFNDMRMRFQLLHCFEFFHQILLVRLGGVDWKIKSKGWTLLNCNNMQNVNALEPRTRPNSNSPLTRTKHCFPLDLTLHFYFLSVNCNSVNSNSPSTRIRVLHFLGLNLPS